MNKVDMSCWTDIGEQTPGTVVKGDVKNCFPSPNATSALEALALACSQGIGAVAELLPEVTRFIGNCPGTNMRTGGCFIELPH